MGKKLMSQASTKITKNDHRKQLNSLIKVLRPKVYITDSSNFKRLVQELTGNGNPPMPCAPPDSIPEVPVVIQVPVVENIIDHDHHASYDHQERSLDSSVDSSEASMPTSFATAIESPQDQLCVSDALFNHVFESSKVDFPVYGDLESWLLESTDHNPFSYSCGDDVSIPTIQQQVGVYNYDFSDLII